MTFEAARCTAKVRRKAISRDNYHLDSEQYPWQLIGKKRLWSASSPVMATVASRDVN
jgi:hypothetical protein